MQGIKTDMYFSLNFSWCVYTPQNLILAVKNRGGGGGGGLLNGKNLLSV